MSGKATMEKIPLGRLHSHTQTKTSPQNLKKGCWDACGRKTVYILGGAVCGLIALTAINMLIGASLMYYANQVSERDGFIEGVIRKMELADLVHIPPLDMRAAFSASFAAVLGYLYANRM